MTKKQSLKERYKRARKNLMKRIETANRYGVSIPESAIPSIPKRITSSSINFLNSLKGEKLYRLSSSYRVQGLTVGQIKGQIVRQQTEQRKLTQEIKQEFQISTQEYKRNMEYYQEALRQGLNAETLEFYKRNGADFGRDKHEYSDTVLSKALQLLNDFSPIYFHTFNQYMYHKPYRDRLLTFFERFTSTPTQKAKLSLALEEIGAPYIENMIKRIVYDSESNKKLISYSLEDLTEELVMTISYKMEGIDRPKLPLFKDEISREDFLNHVNRKMTEQEAMKWIESFGMGKEYNKRWVEEYLKGNNPPIPRENETNATERKSFLYRNELVNLSDWDINDDEE